MTLPVIQQIYDVVDGTWPAAEYTQTGPWLFRRGAGGGQRVSATTAQGRAIQQRGRWHWSEAVVVR